MPHSEKPGSTDNRRLGEPDDEEVAYWRGQETAFPRRRVAGVVRNAAKKARDLRPKVCGVTLPVVTWPLSAKRHAGTCFSLKIAWHSLCLSGFLLQCVTEAQFELTKQKWVSHTGIFKGCDSALDLISFKIHLFVPVFFLSVDFALWQALSSGSKEGL